MYLLCKLLQLLLIKSFYYIFDYCHISTLLVQSTPSAFYHVLSSVSGTSSNVKSNDNSKLDVKCATLQMEILRIIV